MSQVSVDHWLSQFAKADQDLAARVLDSVDFVSHTQIHNTFRDLLGALDGWNVDPTQRKGRWYFVPFSGSSGESGDRMLHDFRVANNLSSAKYNPNFVHRSELVKLQPGPDDTVVLIDDFAGTGNQACDSWRDIFSELLAGQPKVVLMLIAATTHAVIRIERDTEVAVLCGKQLREADQMFRDDCTHFDAEEKKVLLKYCKRASKANPKGYGKLGLLLVLAHRCPNNAVSVLHNQSDGWTPLFPRD